MNIINVDYSFRNKLEFRSITKYIIVHHTASSSATVEDIHKWHKEGNGWSGIGYHAYIRRDGTIYAGRPFGTIGAHCLGKNEESIGICFEGDFTHMVMTEEQKTAGVELLRYLKKLYPEAKLAKHKDFYNTSCPGKNFDDNILKLAENEIDEPVENELYKKALKYLEKNNHPTDKIEMTIRFYDIVKQLDRVERQFKIKIM